MDRHAVVILGMHRSGTSAVTELIGRMGLSLPATLMPPSADNPMGYFESLPISRFNKRLLDSAGTHWRDYAPVPAEWFADPSRDADVQEAASIIRHEFGSAPSFVLKDPSLCRLMPLWRRALSALGVRWSAVLVVRRPSEVARSLAARAADPASRDASVTSAAKASLMWLRHLLDAERHTRDVARRCVDHQRLLTDVEESAIGMIEWLGAGARIESLEASGVAFDCIRPELHRQRVASAADVDGGSPAAVAPTSALDGWMDCLYARARHLGASGMTDALIEDFERINERLDQVHRLYSGMRTTDDRSGPGDRSADAALSAVASCGVGVPGRRSRGTNRKRILYVSGPVRSVGHELRVVNGVQAWREAGHVASWCAADSDDLLARVDEADHVVLFRAKWTPAVAATHASCRARGVPFEFDIDDLVFDPEIIRRGHVAYLDTRPVHEVETWEHDAELFRLTLAASGTASVTTEPLAALAAEVCGTARVVRNTLGPQVEAVADDTWAMRVEHASRSGSDAVRIGYASGTPSHHRDFAVIAGALAQVMREHPRAILTVVGEIDLDRFPELRDCRSRIEARPRVRWPDLPREVARFDVNLAPLEPGSPFCECKSEIRCTMASMVGVPTIASPTLPQRRAIIDGVSGWIAGSPEDWARCLKEALSSAECRAHRGIAARGDAKMRFGWPNVASDWVIA